MEIHNLTISTNLLLLSKYNSKVPVTPSDETNGCSMVTRNRTDSPVLAIALTWRM